MDDDGSDSAGNRTDIGSGCRKDARDNGLAVIGARNRSDAGFNCKGDTRDNGLTVVGGDNGSIVIDNRIAIKDDGLTAGDNRLTVDNVGSITNQTDARLGNKLDADLIMMSISNIRVDLIKVFNNGVFLIILDKLFCIISDKHVRDFSSRIFADVINNLFEDMFPLFIALFCSSLFLFLPASTTSNFGNIPTTFIYYMLICMQNLVFSR